MEEGEDDQHKASPVLGLSRGELRGCYASMLRNSVRTRPAPFFMDRQRQVTKVHRMQLVDWMSEVLTWYGMHDDTLYLAVNCLDRFLGRVVVSTSTLQLVGLAALFTAAKFEEIEAPRVHKFTKMISPDFPIEALTAMEARILSTLNFDLCTTTQRSFLKYAMSLDPLPEHNEAAQLLALVCTPPAQHNKSTTVANTQMTHYGGGAETVRAEPARQRHRAVCAAHNRVCVLVAGAHPVWVRPVAKHAGHRDALRHHRH